MNATTIDPRQSKRATSTRKIVPAPAPVLKSTHEASPSSSNQTAQPRKIPAHFEFRGNATRQVYLACSFNAWQPVPMQKSGKSVWYADLTLQPGRYEYRFIVDGVWQEDPNAREQTPNCFGSRNSVLLLQ